MKKDRNTIANKRKTVKNVSLRVSREFLAEYALADKLYSLVVKQLAERCKTSQP